MDTALVTGATGFIGASIARILLEEGLRVRALARPGSSLKNVEGLDVEIAKGDLLDRPSLESAAKGARYIFHAAADYRLWAPRPEPLFKTNVDGTRHMLEAAWKAGAERIVYTSSVASIRPGSNGTPVDESSEYSSPKEIIGPYKRSKFMGEQVALSFASQGLPVVVVNPAAPVGPYDIKPTPTGKIIVDFLNRRMPAYIRTGLNIVHVRDVARGHLLALRKGRIGERYILGGENLTLKQIFDILSSITGIPAPTFRIPYRLALCLGAADSLRARAFGCEPRIPIDGIRMSRYLMFFDSSKAVRELGLARTPAPQALRDAVEWFSENGYIK